MTRIVVCDTGPLLHLSEAGAIHVQSLAGDIFIPPLVASEFEATSQGWKPPQWVNILELDMAASQKKVAGWIQLRQIEQGKPKPLVWLYS